VLGSLAAGSAASAAPAHQTIPGHVTIRGAIAATTGPFTLLSDASCFHAGDCLAVGEHYSGHPNPVADKWNGSAWGATPVHLPSGATAGFLASVSCKTGGCVAVGSYSRGSTGYGLAAFFNGNVWSVPAQPAAVSGAAQVVLESVSCQSSKSCVAAGYYSPTTNTKDEIGIAEVWNGSTWRVSKAPAEPFSNLDTVSCPTATYCVVGGGYETSAGSFVWALSFDGAHWRTLSLPQPTTTNNHFQYISGVSCPSTTSCAAVGVSVNGSNHSTGITEVLSAGAWHVKTVSWPAGQQSLLISVSCPTASYCIATGGLGAFTTWTNGRAAFAIWTGSAWQAHYAPAPPSGDGNALLGVQCLSSAYCTLVGTQGKASTTTGTGLAGVDNAGTWTWHTTP
jgi:hypothetical protein